MKTLSIAILMLLSTITFAQQKIVWQGGTPGNETSWDEPRNWSTNQVPDEFSDVFINDVSSTTFSTPIVRKGKVELNSIRIASNAQLTISKEARVLVYGYTLGFTQENVTIEGALLVMRDDRNPKFENFSFTNEN